jgi:hypothetical protein
MIEKRLPFGGLEDFRRMDCYDGRRKGESTYHWLVMNCSDERHFGEGK